MVPRAGALRNRTVLKESDMPDLLIVAAQPNPSGRDTARPGLALNHTLNEEWVEFAAQAARNLTGDTLYHETYGTGCARTGTTALYTFPSIQLQPGHRVRVCTGRGTNQWSGTTLYIYLNRDWFVWNNDCGDRATLAYQSTVIDSAHYAARPPEGVLSRVSGTDRLEPAARSAYGAWR